MRILLFACLLCLISACSDASPPVIDRIEMRVSGWSSVDISVNREGAGSYRLTNGSAKVKNGTFQITPQQFDQLVDRLDPFRHEAVPFTEKSTAEFMDRTCPKGVPYTYDAGAVWVHWAGPKTDQHHLVQLGCDATRNEARNKAVLNIVKSLPVPLDW